jgi:phospholipid/cholesterol/gamma-HCH transport system substrate-binding protein
MNKSTGRTIWLGVMVISGALIFMVAVYLIGQKQDMFRDTFNLRVVFSNVNGLQPGNNVRLSGINVGSIVSVAIQNDSTIEVVMRIQDDVRPYIKKNALVTIGTDGLMGNMLVNISPGKGSAAVVEDNDILNSFTRIKTDDILETLNTTNENAAMLTANLLTITQDIRHGKGTISALVYDTLLQQQFTNVIINLRNATVETNSLLTQVKEMTSHVKAGDGLAGWMLKDTLTAQQINKTLSDLQRASTEIHQSTDSLKSFIGDLSSGKGAVPTLMYDTTLSNEIRQILKNLNQGTAKFDENMEALKHSFLTKKYFKEEEKNNNN